MQHAEAHERLADLALEPRALLSFERDPSPEAVALRDHIATCATCTAEVQAWRETHAAVMEALGDPAMQGAGAIAESQPIALPPGLRASVARIPSGAMPAGSPLAGPDSTPRRGPVRIVRFAAFRQASRAWVGLAAVLVLAIVGSGAIALDQAHRADTARADAAELAVLVRTTQAILADPYHTSVTLASSDGTASGLVAWTASDAVVVATHLAAPPAGQVYRCWVERAGTRTPVGEMSYRQGVGYWWQRPNETTGPSIWAGGQFIVTLGPPGGPGGPAVLSGSLPG